MALSRGLWYDFDPSHPDGLGVMWRTVLDYWTVVRVGRVAVDDRRGFVSHRRPRGTWHRDAERGGAGQRLCVDDVGRQRRRHCAIDDCRSGGCDDRGLRHRDDARHDCHRRHDQCAGRRCQAHDGIEAADRPRGADADDKLHSRLFSLAGEQGGVTTHLESGFTVSAVAGDWMAITTYGNPQPFVEFSAPAGTTGTGEIRITAGGAPFWLNSIDFYSSTTKIPYVIEGFFNSEQVFSVVDVIGNTFGAFARRSNPNASTVVDEVRIRLSNPSAPCCTNPMGIDNIVLSR